jgi:hypothetical protein
MTFRPTMQGEKTCYLEFDGKPVASRTRDQRHWTIIVSGQKVEVAQAVNNYGDIIFEYDM